MKGYEKQHTPQKHHPLFFTSHKERLMKEMLRKFFGFAKSGTVSNQTKATMKNLSKRQQALIMLGEIEPFRNKRFNVMSASIIKFEALAPNIIKFIEMLHKFNLILESNGTIKATDCFFVVKETTLDKFFTDEDRMYINQSIISKFIEEATRLCQQLEKGEQAEFGVEEHNLRILSKVLAGIKQICEAIIKTEKA